MSVQSLPPVRRSVTVQAPLEHVFEVFAGRPTAWWPAANSIGSAPLAEVVLERRTGGRWYERGTDDSTCDWGRVLSYEPPTRLLLAWQIDAAWQYDPDPARASEVEVLFAEPEPGTTLVTLEHRHIERHGAGGTDIAAAVAGDGGWGDILAELAAVALAVSPAAETGEAPAQR